MKITKLILTAAAALGFCALSANADVVTTYHSALNVNITVSTNKPETESGNVVHSTVVNGKYGNKQLLDLFAKWTDNNRTVEPWKSAKLEIAWDIDSEVVVVDQTGSNVLFNASEGVSGAYFTVSFFDEFGAGSWSEEDADPGYYNVNDTDSASFTLYDDGVYLPYTYLTDSGGNRQVFHQGWDKNDAPTNWSDTEAATFPFAGEQWFLDIDTTDITVSAQINANGGGKGENYIGWAD